MTIVILLAACALSQIAVAVIGIFSRWNSATLARAFTISLLIRAAALVLALRSAGVPAPRVALLFAIIAISGYLVELLGSRSGFPFGRYRYNNLLRPEIYGVPWQIALAWWVVTIPAFAVASQITAIPIIATALLVAASDLFIDHTCVSIGFWSWRRRGLIFGIPISNYCGWLATAAILAAVAVPILPPLPLYLSTFFYLDLILQAVAYLFIWPWRRRPIALIGLALHIWPVAIYLVMLHASQI